MANVGLGKPVEEPVTNPSAATDGRVISYTSQEGFAEFSWPNNLTVDLGEIYSLHCIRLLLWDGLGEGSQHRSNRVYKYRLLTSVNHQGWKVIFDSSNDGGNGWQLFNFPGALEARYVRVHGLWNSANESFHVVQVEAHDTAPPAMDAETVLERTILAESVDEEIGDGLPLQTRVSGIINGIERLIESTQFLNPAPFRELISQLRIQVRDVASLERGMDSIRREIITPVHRELEHSARLGKFSVWGFWVGLIGGVLAIFSIVLALTQSAEPHLTSPPTASAEIKATLPQTGDMPRSFFYINRDDKGRRDWTRMGENTWIERSASRIKEFGVSDRIIQGACTGSVMYDIRDREMEVYIPDKNCPTKQIMYRYKKGAWISAGEMTDVQ